jgi:hypothetical protein
MTPLRLTDDACCRLRNAFRWVIATRSCKSSPRQLADKPAGGGNLQRAIAKAQHAWSRIHE